MTNRPLLLSTVALFAALGCAGSVKNMREAVTVNAAAAPNDAVVIFMRPSGMGFAVQSSVFEVADNQPARLVGIVAAKKKLAYRTSPGSHRFMIIGESADFMDAVLEAGKVYYALATVRMGVWKARFSLKPVHVFDRPELAAWSSDTAWVEVTEDSFRWAQENAGDVEAKRSEYLPKWMQKAPADRPALMPEDGQP